MENNIFDFFKNTKKESLRSELLKAFKYIIENRDLAKFNEPGFFCSTEFELSCKAITFIYLEIPEIKNIIEIDGNPKFKKGFADKDYLENLSIIGKIIEDYIEKNPDHCNDYRDDFEIETRGKVDLYITRKNGLEIHFNSKLEDF